MIMTIVIKLVELFTYHRPSVIEKYIGNPMHFNLPFKDQKYMK
jgi:hypothetical protein